jgi:hypothetical protein
MTTGHLPEFPIHDETIWQSVFVAHDVKNHTVIGNKACIAIHLFQIIKISKIALDQQSNIGMKKFKLAVNFI